MVDEKGFVLHSTDRDVVLRHSDGTQRKVSLNTLNPAQRRALYRMTKQGPEPLALWLNEDGQPRLPHSWEHTFQGANKRIAKLGSRISRPHLTCCATAARWFAIGRLAMRERFVISPRRTKDFRQQFSDTWDLVAAYLGHRNPEPPTDLSGASFRAFSMLKFCCSTCRTRQCRPSSLIWRITRWCGPTRYGATREAAVKWAQGRPGGCGLPSGGAQKGNEGSSWCVSCRNPRETIYQSISTSQVGPIERSNSSSFRRCVQRPDPRRQPCPGAQSANAPPKVSGRSANIWGRGSPPVKPPRLTPGLDGWYLARLRLHRTGGLEVRVAPCRGTSTRTSATPSAGPARLGIRGRSAVTATRGGTGGSFRRHDRRASRGGAHPAADGELLADWRRGSLHQWRETQQREAVGPR